MAAPLSGTLTPIRWSVQPAQVGNLAISIARLDIGLYLRTVLPGRRVVPEQSWLDTGAPLSVIPFHVHNKRLDWKPLPGGRVTWAGQPCDLGHIDLWLSTRQPPFFRGPLSLLAKFPRSDPPGQRVSVLLGLECILTLQAALMLPPPPQPGHIQVP